GRSGDGRHVRSGCRPRRPDISLATEELGWRPKVNLAEGLAHTIRYFDDLLSRSMRESAELV
ncbi:hypothetical protein GHK01_33415, partial [Sinorhizobium meliloti]|nr:hypothetical protein [Sinorhizobium meliloti]